MFFDGFSPKTNLLGANNYVLYCYEFFLTISQTRDASERTNSDNFVMIHRQIHTDTHARTHARTYTQTLPTYMADFILPCNDDNIIDNAV